MRLPPVIRYPAPRSPLADPVRAYVGKDVRGGVPNGRAARSRVKRVDENVVELGERLRRSAQITLATCSVSAQVLDHSRDGAAVFDWVIVEEAAKAWPNELLIPLVQGLRWTLIGDHRQLGAHRAEDLERFLEHLAGRGRDGRHVVGARGGLALPTTARQLCGMAPGPPVVLAGYPPLDLVVMHPVSTWPGCCASSTPPWPQVRDAGRPGPDRGRAT